MRRRQASSGGRGPVDQNANFSLGLSRIGATASRSAHDVLLRHRPRSISRWLPGERHDCHEYGRFLSIGLPVLEVPVAA